MSDHPRVPRKGTARSPKLILAQALEFWHSMFVRRSSIMPMTSQGEYIFKTVYFPGERVRKGSSARVTVSIPINHGASPEFLEFVAQLSSRDFRLAIGDPILEDLEAQAEKEGRSFSNICVRI